jgi:hypothetical protein
MTDARVQSPHPPEPCTRASWVLRSVVGVYRRPAVRLGSAAMAQAARPSGRSPPEQGRDWRAVPVTDAAEEDRPGIASTSRADHDQVMATLAGLAEDRLGCGSVNQPGGRRHTIGEQLDGLVEGRLSFGARSLHQLVVEGLGEGGPGHRWPCEHGGVAGQDCELCLLGACDVDRVSQGGPRMGRTVVGDEDLGEYLSFPLVSADAQFAGRR